MTMNEPMSDQLVVLLEQECTYRASNYLGRTMVSTGNQNLLPTPTGTKKRKLDFSSLYDQQLHKAFCTEKSKDNGMKIRGMNEEWRLKMVEWTYRVVDHFDLDREIVFVATNYLDRCLATHVYKACEKDNLQLLTMTCLYLAMKLYGRESITLPGSASMMESLLYLAKSKFSLEQMKEMEYEVLHLLKWRCHPPTPQNFIHLYSQLFSKDETMLLDYAHYLAELSSLDYFFVSYKASEIAIASLLCTVEVVAKEKPSRFDSLFPKVVSSSQDHRIFECKDRLKSLFSESGENFEYDLIQAAKECRISSPVSVF